MYKKPKFESTSININTSTEGQTIEQKVRLLMENKEPIPAEKSLSYNESRSEILPANDIRTDRFELAVDVNDKLEKNRIAKSEHLRVIKDKEEAENKGNEQKNGTTTDSE
jgi:hypothetical protein